MVEAIDGGGGVEEHEGHTEDAAADDVSTVSPRPGRHHEHYESDRARRQARAVRDGVGDLFSASRANSVPLLSCLVWITLLSAQRGVVGSREAYRPSVAID
jgi:hypothetical protein